MDVGREVGGSSFVTNWMFSGGGRVVLVGTELYRCFWPISLGLGVSIGGGGSGAYK